MPPRFLACLAAVTIGCVRPPEPAKLEPAKARAVDVIAAGGASSFCVNGRPPQLKAVVTLETGAKLETWSESEPADGKLRFEEFEWSSSLGRVGDQGWLMLSVDPLELAEVETVTVRARIAARPELAGEVVLRPTFACDALVSARGASGASGFSGSSGPSGGSGQAGSASQSATAGAHGGPGGHGEDGGPGGHAGHAEVAVGVVETPLHGRLAVARIGDRSILFDPRAARLVIDASGGDGGAGGRGGGGGSGGNGGSHTITDPPGPGAPGGDGGDGGDGGSGGDGGDGGSIAIKYDARFPELAERVVGLVDAGRGGQAGDAGEAGRGGDGGTGEGGRSAARGRDGQRGRSGRGGRDGRPGSGVTVVAAEVVD